MPRRESIDLATRRRLREHVAAALDEFRLNAAALAKRIGVRPSTISSILSGDRTVGFDVFIKLHKGLGLSANYMLDEDPRPQVVPRPLRPERRPSPPEQAVRLARRAE